MSEKTKENGFVVATKVDDAQYKTFSVRFDAAVANTLEAIARENRCSKNDVVRQMVSYAIEHYERE